MSQFHNKLNFHKEKNNRLAIEREFIDTELKNKELELLSTTTYIEQRNNNLRNLRDNLNAASDFDSNKSTICFSVPNSSGSLAKILTFLASNKLNLTKIQSHPKLGKNWEYFFYLDLLFDNISNYKNMLAKLKGMVTDLMVLGIYKNGIKHTL